MPKNFVKFYVVTTKTKNFSSTCIFYGLASVKRYLRDWDCKFDNGIFVDNEFVELTNKHNDKFIVEVAAE